MNINFNNESLLQKRKNPKKKAPPGGKKKRKIKSLKCKVAKRPDRDALKIQNSSVPRETFEGFVVSCVWCVCV